ncbi:MAG: pyruvate dehydrogenase E2 component (dihydrolipoamide acetyltransferase) [Alphaproteobacteria bacterium]|jgi:pyruvate dehydrogenase E2 component (dihydrolipoamide acetyltransferase)
MAITIRMPALSPTMTEGTLASWIKKEGDAVRSGDVIAEIETDKATMEVEAVEEGTLGKILVKAGAEGVAVNAPIAILLEEGEDKSALAAAVKAAGDTAPAPAAKQDAAPPAPQPAPVAEAAAPAPNVESKPAPKAPAKPIPAPAASGGRVFASPLARRLAKDSGLEISRITGSGPHGRIIAADVEAFAASGGASAGGGGIFAGMGQGFQPAGTRIEPHSNMRKVIARRLSESTQTVPHFYVTMDCDIDSLLAVRKEINDTDETLKVSVNDFVIRACGLALRQVPEANVSWGDDGMTIYDAADISIAVATDAGGLITPIVRAADKKGLAAISTEMKDLAVRARTGKLKPEEYQGGTFSISNMGMFGVREFTAIINPPQSCILAVGAGAERAVVRDGELGIATVMTLTLSCDHRSVDGALGAKLLGAIKELIEHPVRLVL